MNAVNKWPIIIQDILFPPTCVLCGDRGQRGLDLCLPCRHDLPWLEPGCPVCALPHGGPTLMPCGACQKHPPPYQSLQAAFRYEEPVRHLVQALKFGSRHAHARVLGVLLAEHILTAGTRPEVILPVPLSGPRYRARGFNQSLEIARSVARQTGIPLDLAACRRIRTTDAQARLSADERRRNIRDAFATPAVLPYRHVALLDDVVTTGATVGELAKTLRRSGVERIDVWACARALT